MSISDFFKRWGENIKFAWKLDPLEHLQYPEQIEEHFERELQYSKEEQERIENAHKKRKRETAAAKKAADAEKAEKLNQLKQQKAEMEQLFYWKDYVNITKNPWFLNTANQEQLKELKQNLLKEFKFSETNDYLTALNVVEKKLKAS